MTGDARYIVEAKRGWQLPQPRQLEKYAKRVGEGQRGGLVTLSECSAAWAEQRLPPSVLGVAVQHLPWSVVIDLTERAVRDARGSDRFWAQELTTYLRRAVKMRDPFECLAYCVVLSSARTVGGGDRTSRDYLERESVYFHPFGWGHGWPVDPPNLFAFRWKGQVHQVRRVLRSEVLPSLQDRWPEIPRDEDSIRPHFIHDLGPAIPMDPLPAGKNYRDRRLLVLLDFLLTSSTLDEAERRTKAIEGRVAVDR